MTPGSGSAKALARTSIVLSGVLLAYAALAVASKLGAKATNNPDDSIAKLKRIGVALQLYRQEAGVLPPEKRKTYVDAGLPPSMALLVSEQGHSWSLPLSAFQVDHPRVPEISIHFRELYYTDALAKKHDLPDMATYLSGRGDKLPVLQDMNYPKPEMWNTSGKRFETPVLRLDGSVELIWVDAKSGGTFTKEDCILGK